MFIDFATLSLDCLVNQSAKYRYMSGGQLAVPMVVRTQAGALLNPSVAAEQGLTLARSGRYDTICIHGDTPGAGRIASSVRDALREAGIETSPLSS